MHPRVRRTEEIGRLRSNLELRGFPRLQMLLIVAVTGSSGYLASFLMFHAGLGEMWLRYILAVAFAYVTYLFLLWLWLKTNARDYDIPDLSGIGSGRSDEAIPVFVGRGGQSGGGGASGSFDGPAPGPTGVAFVEDDGGVVGETVGAVASADEMAIPLAVVAIIVAMLVSSLWVVYTAPTLFAELLVDGVLAAGLYRRLKKIETQHWLETAIQRTVWPFVITLIIIGIAGSVISHNAPGAESLGQALLYWDNAK